MILGIGIEASFAPKLKKTTISLVLFILKMASFTQVIEISLRKYTLLNDLKKLSVYNADDSEV